ncbi:hypothetical protein QQ045_018910 [Rhodiola kirilowii]
MESAEQEQTQPPRWRRVRKPPPQPQSQHQDKEKVPMDEESTTPTAISTGLFKSRKRFATELCSDKMLDDTNGHGELGLEEKTEESTPSDDVLSERRKALFEPLEPNINGKRASAESLLPPPDFDAASYPKGWLIGKKRKLVNVDVVESMRRIAVQEMNRKVLLSKTSVLLCASRKKEKAL